MLWPTTLLLVPPLGLGKGGDFEGCAGGGGKCQTVLTFRPDKNARGASGRGTRPLRPDPLGRWEQPELRRILALLLSL